MNEFCEKLEFYMKKKKVTGKQICDYAGISTVGFSRLKSGEKKKQLTAENFNKMCRVLELTDSEQDELRDLYDFWYFSKPERYCIETVKRILKKSCVFEESLPEYKTVPIESVSGEENVIDLIYSAFAQQSSGRVFILSQLCNRRFINILRVIMLNNNKLDLENIFSFCSAGTENYYAENIRRFERISDLLFSCTNYSLNLNYTDDQPPDITLVFFEDFMLLVPDDMQFADVLRGDLFRRNKMSLIEKYRSSYNLFKSIRNDIFSYDSLRDKSFQLNKNNVNMLEEYPCIKPVLEYEDIIENFGSNPFTEQIWEMIRKMKDEYLTTKKSVKSFFSKRALLDFLEKGYYSEYVTIGVPIKPEIILRLIKRMKKLTLEGYNPRYIIIDDEILPINPYFFLEHKDNGTVMFDFMAGGNELFRCYMSEPSIYICKFA